MELDPAHGRLDDILIGFEGILSEDLIKTDLYYTANWQVIEERIGNTVKVQDV